MVFSTRYVSLRGAGKKDLTDVELDWADLSGRDRPFDWIGGVASCLYRLEDSVIDPHP